MLNPRLHIVVSSLVEIILFIEEKLFDHRTGFNKTDSMHQIMSVKLLDRLEQAFA